MKDMEKQKFEREWRDAFREAEVSPSDNLWTNIELDLEKAESGKMKRRLLYYKLTAAASIAFALCIAGVGTYFYNNQSRFSNGANGALAIDAVQTQKTSTVESQQKSSGANGNKKDNNLKKLETINANQTLTNDNTSTTPSLNNLSSKNNEAAPVNTTASNAAQNKSTDKSIVTNASKGVSVAGNRLKDNNTNSIGNNPITDNPSPTNADKNSGNAISNKPTSNKPTNGLIAGNDKYLTKTKKNNTGNAQPIDAVVFNNNNADAGIAYKNDKSLSTNGGVTNNTIKQAEEFKRTGGIQQVQTNNSTTTGVSNERPAYLQGDGIAEKNAINRVGDIPPSWSDKNNLPPLTSTKKVSLNIPQSTPDPVAVMMAKLYQREQELRDKKVVEKKKDTKDTKMPQEKLWTTLGIAAGAFNTNKSQTPTSATSLAGNAAKSQSRAPGNTYSLGLAVGTKLSNRWVVQGGVNYLTQISSYKSESAVSNADFNSFRVAGLNELNSSESADNTPEANNVKAVDSKVVGIAKYDVNSQVQFVSVPLQAGYLAINRKLGLLINAGMATDLFIRNTITPDNNDVDRTTQKIGGKSDYQPVNFNGLLNTELSYRLGKYYRLAINPGLRYPFSSIYKSETGITTTPITIDVGMKFRYIFH